jgi:hypothetical protein
MKRNKALPLLGETWLTRSGIHVTVIKQFQEDNTFRGIDDRGVVYRFYEDGSYLGPTYVHSMDLVTKL